MQTRRTVVLLRVLLSCAFAVLSFAQLRAVPAIYDDWVRDAPDAAVPRWPVLLMAVVLLLLEIAAAVVCLLLVVLRALLRQATSLQSELEAVV